VSDWADDWVRPRHVDGQLSFETIPRARAGDPQTSHDAAASVEHLRQSQIAVLATLVTLGEPATDEQIADAYRGRWPRQSPSGLRTRRSELVEAGLVEDSGVRVTMSTGRKAIAWQVVS
jgi:hypothetical protein